jgi:DNA gyrase subunit A
MRVTDRIGQVVGVRMVKDEDDLMLITDTGKVIRTPVRGISVIGRNTQGVRLIDLSEGEKVVGIACVAQEPEGEVEEQPEAAGDDGGNGSSEPPASA